jgi:parallel beta-helix repeat protein
MEKTLIVLFIAGFVLFGCAQSGPAGNQQSSGSQVAPAQNQNAIPVNNSGKVLYVSSGGNAAGATGSSSNPFKTINDALAVSGPGYTIVVGPGKYNEQVNIDNSVKLLGAGQASTVINASGYSNGVHIGGQATNGTVVANFTIENANDHGIFVENTFNVMISDNNVVNNGLSPNNCPEPPARPTGPCIADDKAIDLSGTINSTVQNNIVSNNLEGGIGVTDIGEINPGAPISMNISMPSKGNRIVGNTVAYNNVSCGIIMASYNSAGVLNNTAEGNIVVGNPFGIVVATDTPYSTAQFNIVKNNTANDNIMLGIIFHSNAPGDILSYNSILYNALSGNGMDPDPSVNVSEKTAIVISGTVMPVTNSLVANNTISNEYYGIWMKNNEGTMLDSNIFQNVTVENFTKSAG